MGKRAAFTSSEELEKKVQEYFDRCKSSQKIYELKNGDIKIRQEFPTMSGLASFLGVSRDTLYSFINGEDKEMWVSADELKLISDTLSRARQDIATALAQASLSGDADAKIAAMLLTAMGEAANDSSPTVNIVIQGDAEAYSV